MVTSVGAWPHQVPEENETSHAEPRQDTGQIEQWPFGGGVPRGAKPSVTCAVQVVKGTNGHPFSGPCLWHTQQSVPELGPRVGFASRRTCSRKSHYNFSLEPIPKIIVCTLKPKGKNHLQLSNPSSVAPNSYQSPPFFYFFKKKSELLKVQFTRRRPG